MSINSDSFFAYYGFSTLKNPPEWAIKLWIESSITIITQKILYETEPYYKNKNRIRLERFIFAQTNI